MTQASKIRWGILGPGTIARAFAGGVAHSRTGTLVALGARDPSKPGYAEQFPGARSTPATRRCSPTPRSTPSISRRRTRTTPNGRSRPPRPASTRWSRSRSASPPTRRTRCSTPPAAPAPSWARPSCTGCTRRPRKLVELIAGGEIGEVRMIQSSFGFAMPAFDPTHRLYANELAGGGILDVGCYPVSMARLIAGAAAGSRSSIRPRSPAPRISARPASTNGPPRSCSFPNGIIAEVSCAVSLAQENVLRILGTTGRIEVADFWFASGHEGGTGRIEVIPRNGEPRTVEVDGGRLALRLRGRRRRRRDPRRPPGVRAPGMSWDDTLGNMRVLDKWRADVGLAYGIERPAARPRTIAQHAARPPRRADPAQGDRRARHARPRWWRSASRISRTSPAPRSCSTPSTRRGGNVFDTAWVYGMGRTERCSASGSAPAACATRWWSSARARIRR